MIPSENISALTQNRFCRCLKHVSPVADMQGNVAESYVYDPAGNILSKTVNGKTTTYTYDKANQLVSSTTDGKVTKYQYDAAGRLVQEGDKSYSYGWLDKVLSVTENGQQIASFNYHNDGQIAQAIHGDQSEEFFWDGLALIHRGETSFINEPYVTGGNPILSSKDGVMFNDMLGSTLNISGKAIHMTAFGESSDTNAMFTGKPYIGELGYTFLFRNYRADQGKWQTTDPLGYPDGWNNLAYCNNGVSNIIDVLGGTYYQITINLSAIAGGGGQGNFGFSYDSETGNINLTGGLGGGNGCNISASLGITVNEGSPSTSSTIVTTEAGGGVLGKATIVVSTDINGNLSSGGTLGVSLTPISGSVSITQQWNTTLFNVNNIADAINAAYNPNNGWLSGFFYDIFYRSGNKPYITGSPQPE